MLLKGCSQPTHSLADYAAGGDGTSVVPFWRWDADSMHGASAAGAAAEVQPRFGVFMPGVDLFDCTAFGISPLEATTMDPQQRLLLRAAAEAMPPASSSSSSVGSSQQLLTGVYVGIGTNDYEVLASHVGVSVSAFSFTAASAAVASGRLAYIFGLQGPSASIDTACSASLVALHMAASNLADGSTDAALVAGVLLSLVPQSTLMVQRAGMLAADGRAKVLDAEADGYVRGEACRAMWLEAAASGAQAEAATAEPSAPLAVLLGTAVNTNGRASSLTAPHGPTQQALIAGALEAAGMAATEVSGLQLHANGTSLGDPIEIGAVVPAYQLAADSSSSRPAFVFSTIKGYAGHSEAAAGAVGVLEAVSVMMQQALAPVLHVRQLNPYVAAPLQGRNAVINRSTGLAPVPVWQDTAVQSAGAAGAKVAMGVSSFGAQGTNAHAILCHSHSWALARAGIAASTAGGGSQQQQLAWQQQRFWVTPVHQRLISRAVISRPERSSKRPASLRVAFEVRLDAPGSAGLWWSYLSTPAAPGQAAQPFLCNSLLLAAAASAGSLLASGNNMQGGQQLLLQSAVLAPPQQLPAYPGQPGVQMTVLLVACNVGTGSLTVDISGQRQLQCTMAVADASAGASDTDESHSSGSMSSRLAALLGPGLTAAATAAAAVSAPGALLGAQHRQQQMHAVGALAEHSDSGFVLHPASLESSLQSCMVTAGAATALWLSTVQALSVPLGSASMSDAAGAGKDSSDSWVTASFAHASDGSSCQVHNLSSSTGGSSIRLTGALLAADATTATEAAAASAEAAAGVTSEEAAAAALSAVTSAANPVMQLDEAERALYLQAQIMSEVSQGH
jgi:3-oxoacyl-(acyl-carrier-protein) synthase